MQIKKFSVEISEIEEISKRLREINSHPLDKIAFLDKDGKPIVIEEELIKKFKFTGLNNVDFVLTGFYQSGKVKPQQPSKADYLFTTEKPLLTNEETMRVFLEEHFHEVFGQNASVIHEEGTYIEVEEKVEVNAFGIWVNDLTWGVHAGGDGDFTSHRIRFELLSEW